VPGTAQGRAHEGSAATSTSASGRFWNLLEEGRQRFRAAKAKPETLKGIPESAHVENVRSTLTLSLRTRPAAFAR